MKKSKIIIVMPAYNAAKTVKDTYREIPLYLRDHIILVDDKSMDDTVRVAKQLGVNVLVHSRNVGYGGNQKTCYTEALKHKPAAVIMLHPDYQYDAAKLPQLIEPILNGTYDFMFGSRMADGGAIKGGMPKLKYVLNRVFCKLENMLLGVNLTEHFSGLRAYSADVLRTVPFTKFSDDFVFDQQMELSALSYSFRIGEIPISTRYHKKASSIRFLKGSKFLIETLWQIVLFKLHQWRLRKSPLFAEKTT
jgi:glycosyltransferase involved in cell wall biosynthesis